MGIQHWICRLILICCLTAGATIVFGQNMDNPFELKERIKEQQAKEKDQEAEEEQQVDYSNPFEVDHNKKETEGVSFQFPAIENLPEVEKTGPVSHLFIGFIILLLLLLIAFLNTAYSNELRNILKAFSNENILKLQLRQNTATVKLSSTILYFIYVVIIGVFFFYIGNHFGFMPDGNWMLLLCIVLTGLLTAGRFLLLSLLGNIFPFHKELRQYAYTITIFDFVVGIILVPIVIFFAFSPKDISQYFIYIGLAIIGLIYLYRSFRGLQIANKYLFLHKFHFFLYLCTVEIAPLAILVKLITSWGTMI